MAKLEALEYKPFEAIKQIDENGREFWLARDLQVTLEYSEWRNFKKVIDKAMLACKNAKHPIVDHFVDTNKTLNMPNSATKVIPDYKLTRYACYLLVQNGNPRKEVIALGQTYFAIQTRRAEVAETFNELSENNKRLVVRGDIKHWNQLLAEAAHRANIITNTEFADFQNSGYRGLYGGLTVGDIHARKKLKKAQKILDHMGSRELIANLFRISQAEGKLNKEEITNAEMANHIHFDVGDKVRKAIIDMNATLPENLPKPDKSIQAVERLELAKLKRNKLSLLDE